MCHDLHNTASPFSNPLPTGLGLLSLTRVKHKYTFGSICTSPVQGKKMKMATQS
jgi:hypothetical protein